MNCAAGMVYFGIVLLCFGTVVSTTADGAMADNTVPEKTKAQRKPGRKAKVARYKPGMKITAAQSIKVDKLQFYRHNALNLLVEPILFAL